MKIKNFILKLQGLSDLQKKIIIAFVVAIFGIGLGYLWILDVGYQMRKASKALRDLPMPSINVDLGKETILDNLPTPTAITNWKIYTNESYGFEIKIPSDWTTKKDSNQIGFISPEANEYNKQNQANCTDNDESTKCDAENVAADIVFTDNYSPDKIINEEQVKFGSLTFAKYQQEGSFFGEPHYRIVKNNKSYDFAAYNDNLISQILPTFKFIN